MIATGMVSCLLEQAAPSGEKTWNAATWTSACRRLSHGRVPGCELIEDTTVAFGPQRIQRYAAVEEQDQVTGRAPGGGVGRVGVLAGSGREAGDSRRRQEWPSVAW